MIEEIDTVEFDNLKEGVWCAISKREKENTKRLSYLCSAEEDILLAKIKAVLLQNRDDLCIKLYNKIRPRIPEDTYLSLQKSEYSLTKICEEVFKELLWSLKDEKEVLC